MCVLFTVHTTNLAYDFQPDIGEMYKLSLKYWSKRCIKKFWTYSPQIRNNLFVAFASKSNQAYINSYSHAMFMLCLCSCNPSSRLPNLARLLCTPPLMIKTPLTPTSLNPTPVARLCATGAGLRAASLYVWPLPRNICRTSWVRQTNWGLGMSYAAYTAYAVYQSIHLVYTALSACWFMKERLSSTMQQMAHFMGHKTRWGDGDCMDYHVREKQTVRYCHRDGKTSSPNLAKSRRAGASMRRSASIVMGKS